MNIAMTIDSVAMVIFMGIGNATAIMTGNLIGGGKEKQADHYAGKSIILGIGMAILIGISVIVSFNMIITLFNVSQEVIDYAHDILTIISIFLWIRVTNLIVYIGILRAGGDTRYAFLIDVGTVWLIGVPLAAIGAFIWDLPIQWVYLLVMGDEIAKCVLGIIRYRSRKWIHNLVISA
jgi:Na+-driven multidrug efflux pump